MDGDGVRRLWVSVDESGIDGTNAFYGFGSLWMPDQRRGDFARIIRDLRSAHGFGESGEFKWTKVTLNKLAFYKDVVTKFFETSYLAFHCIVVRKGFVDRAHFDNDMEQAMLVHLYTLLTNKVTKCMQKAPGRKHMFKVWVDKLPSAYAKADEALHIIIINNALMNTAGQKAIEGVETKDSKDAPSIQLCDLLLGAVADAWNREPAAEGEAPSGRASARAALAKHIASFLRWGDMRASTFPGERKFNVWYFEDPDKREVEVRPVHLVHPLPEHVRGSL